MVTRTYEELQDVERFHIKIRKDMKERSEPICAHCGSRHMIECANIRGHEYSFDARDYIYLCRCCHRKYDNRNNVMFVIGAMALLYKNWLVDA